MTVPGFVLGEGLPAEPGARFTLEREVPGICLGNGPAGWRSLLKFSNNVGMGAAFPAKFLCTSMNAFDPIRTALITRGQGVRAGRFPGSQDSYMLPKDARDVLNAWRPSADPAGDLHQPS